jgi:hypothetical protein
VYSAKDFTKSELSQLNRISNAVILKGGNSLEHLLEEATVNLHIPHKRSFTREAEDHRKHQEKRRYPVGKKCAGCG